MKLSKSKAFLALLFSLFAFFAIPAHAALNAGISTAFTGLQTDALDLVDMVWPVLIAVTMAFIILRLFPKAANKAV